MEVLFVYVFIVQAVKNNSFNQNPLQLFNFSFNVLFLYFFFLILHINHFYFYFLPVRNYKNSYKILKRILK